MIPRGWRWTFLALSMAALPLQGLAQSGLAPPLEVPKTEGATGEATAQFNLAERYHHGSGVLQNFTTAARLYQQAAEQGHAGAQNRMGQYHHAGLGAPQDQAVALRWLQAAAAQGDPQHLFDLAMALEQGTDGSSDPTRAAALYQQAATAGHQTAAVNLGVLYQQGSGVTQDVQRAAVLFNAPAQAGDARAQNNLGLLYVRGTGVTQDYGRAALLFAAAAEQGLAIAMTNLSVMYANGFGVEQSDKIAADWERRASQLRQDQTTSPTTATSPCGFDQRLAAPKTDAVSLARQQQAAESGDPIAQFLAGWLLCNRAEATAMDLRQAAWWFRAAALKGHSASMANLGRLYLSGQGLPQDYQRAYQWMTLAQSFGLSELLEDSTALRQRMTAVQINAAQAEAEILWQQLRTPQSFR